MQEVRLAAVEHEVNGIDRYDHGQQRRPGLTAGDEVAGIDALIGDAAGYRRADFCPLEIELGLLEGGLERGHLRGGVAFGRSPGIELPLGQGLAAHQWRGTLYVERCDLVLCLRPLHVGLRLLEAMR